MRSNWLKESQKKLADANSDQEPVLGIRNSQNVEATFAILK